MPRSFMATSAIGSTSVCVRQSERMSELRLFTNVHPTRLLSRSHYMAYTCGGFETPEFYNGVSKTLKKTKNNLPKFSIVTHMMTRVMLLSVSLVTADPTDSASLRAAEARLASIRALPLSGKLSWISSLPFEEQRQARKLIGLTSPEYSPDTFLRYLARAQQDKLFFEKEGGVGISGRLYPFLEGWKQDDPASYIAFTRLFTSDKETLQSICDARFNRWFDSEMALFKDDCRGVVSKQVSWVGSHLSAGVTNAQNAIQTAKNAMAYFKV